MQPHNLTPAQYQTFKAFNCLKANLPQVVLQATKQVLPNASPLLQTQYALQAMHNICNGNPHGVGYWLLQGNSLHVPQARSHFAIVVHLYKPGQIAKWQQAAQALLNGTTPLCNGCTCVPTIIA